MQVGGVILELHLGIQYISMGFDEDCFILKQQSMKCIFFLQSKQGFYSEREKLRGVVLGGMRSGSKSSCTRT